MAGTLVRAALAAATAALAGMLAWYGLVRLTGVELGWMSWVVGVLVGFATRKAARGPDSTTGAFAVLCSALAILGGGYLAVSHSESARLGKEADRIYSKMLAFSPRVCGARTEDEIRAVLADLNCEDDTDTPNLAAVSEDQMMSFENETRPRYRAVLDGNPTRNRFVGDFIASHRQNGTAILEESLTVWTFLWVILGGSVAFVVASGLRKETERRPPLGAESPSSARRTAGGFKGGARR